MLSEAEGSGELGAQTAAWACSRVCGASTAIRPVAGSGWRRDGRPGGAEGPCRRVIGAATAKWTWARLGCSAAGPAIMLFPAPWHFARSLCY